MVKIQVALITLAFGFTGLSGAQPGEPAPAETSDKASGYRLPWNSPAQEFGPSLSQKGNLYFYTNKDHKDTDIYVSKRMNGEFTRPVAVKELNSKLR